jgi:translocation and assembly module TamB
LSRIILTAVVALAAFIACCAWLLLGTTAGASWLVGLGQQRIPGELAVAEIRGTLVEGLTATSVAYRNGDLVVRLEDVRLELELADLAAGSLVVRKLDAASVTLNELPLELAASAVGSIGFGADVPIDARLQWRQVNGQARGAGTFVGPLNRMSFAHEIELPDMIEIKGTLENIIAAPAVDAVATWDAVALPQQEFGTLISRDGRLSVNGSIDAYRANVTTELVRDGEQRLLASLVAHGSAKALTIDSLDLEGYGGQLLATGTVGFADPPVVELSVSGSDFDPSMLLPAFDGRLSFNGRIDARWPQRFVLDLERLSGEFRGMPVGGSAELLAADGALQSASARLRSGANRLNLELSGGERLAGEFDIDAPELDALWPGLAGSLTGSGTVTGSLETPKLRVRMVGSQLSLHGRRMERLEAAAEIDDSGEVDVDLRAAGLRVADQSFGDLRVVGSGTLATHVLDVELAGGIVSTSFRTRGAYDGKQLTEILEVASVDTDVGAWTLREAATATVGAAGVGVSAHCWDSGGASACVGDIEYVGERFVAGLQLKRFPLQALNPWLGGDLALEGRADATVAIERDAEHLDAEVNWSQRDTKVVFAATDVMVDEASAETLLPSVDFRLVADNSSAVLTGVVIGAFGLTANVDLRTENPLAADGALAGSVNAEIPDIGELRPLIDRYVTTEGLVGALVVDVDVGGTRAAPSLDGGARLRDGSVMMPVFGITVEDVEIEVAAGDDDTLVVIGSARSGDGRLDLSGNIGVSPDAGLYADIAVVGERFELVRLPDQNVLVSPNLSARFDGGQIQVDGKLFVPEAAFTFRELADDAIATSDDIVVHREDADPDAARSRSRIAGQLDIELGDAVTFDGLEISTRLTGGILLTLRPDTPPAGEGALQLADGTFNALGREMTIERGSLNFYGPLDDPVVDARASRRVRYEGDSIKIGIQLSGRLSEKLDFVLFSEPSMSENDVLSYMVVGRPASTGDGNEGAISGAALALGLQSLSATRRAGESLTLDEIGFEGGGANDTAVVAGKRLSDKWYIRYSYGLFNRIGTFIIRYELGRGFSVEAGSGAQQSLDLIYSIDR